MNKLLSVFITVSLLLSCVNEEKAKLETSIVDGDKKKPQENNGDVNLPFEMPDIPDTVYFANEVIPLDDLDIRERFDRELVVNNFWHSNTMFYFKRANRWFPIIRPILKKHGIPDDFIYLAVIESGLTQAISPSNAVGFWQFLKGTAQDYGLEVNQYVDERKNVEKSTIAACEYLKKAYNKFGSWSLAAAAYNRGKSGINNDLNNQFVDSFYDLYLNEETSRYVFRILAIKHIMENAKDYGFKILEKELYSVIETEEVRIEESIPNLAQWAKERSLNYKIIKKLNPWILGNELPISSDSNIAIEIPAEQEQLSAFEVIVL
jgi:hypothetical protein